MRVSSNRRVVAQPYLFEIFILINFAVILAATSGHTLATLKTLPGVFLTLLPSFGGQCIVGVGVRLLVGWIRGNARAYWRIVKSPGWLLDSARLVVFAVLVAHTYAWIKLTVPILHPHFFDQELWNLDRSLFFGLSPSIFFLSLFSQPLSLRVIDTLYVWIFFASMTIAFAYFLSAPRRRLRIGFMSGNAILWLSGAWLYMLVPSLGPAYGFPDVWLRYGTWLGRTQELQAVLLQNFMKVLRSHPGGQETINIFLGVGAFPSLHVAFQTYAFLWMRRLWIYGQIVFGLFAFVILLGSVVTGWHYLVDGYAGILLALLAYWIGAWSVRLRRWSASSLPK